jgi:hypothetical protein
MPDKEYKYVELFYDHYKDTFEQIKGYIKRRNICTIIILCLLVFLFFRAFNPMLINSILEELISNNIGNIQIDFEIIITVLYFSLSWILATYYRATLIIEKQYHYIHKIEEQLTDAMKPFRIEREGKNYLNNYSLFFELIDIFYKITFPVIIVFFAILSWIYEKNNMVNSSLFWFNTFILLCVAITPFMYFFHIHFNDFKRDKLNAQKKFLCRKKKKA